MSVTSRLFNTVLGSKQMSHPSLVGATIYWVKRQGLEYDETLTTIPGNRQFHHFGSTITFNNPFVEVPPLPTSPALGVSERVWIMYG